MVKTPDGPVPGKKAFAPPKKAVIPLFPMRASAVSVRLSLCHRVSLQKGRRENEIGFSRPFLTSAPAFLPGQQGDGFERSTKFGEDPKKDLRRESEIDKLYADCP
jgi:hypothetical protein